jgi:hypothetical protein
MRLFDCTLAGLVAATVVAAPVFGDTILIAGDTADSTEGLGDFTGSINYEFDMFTGGMLTIELTNTSPLGNGGFLTGFLFNIDSTDPGAHAMLTNSPDYPLFEDTFSQSGAPFGTFDSGAALGGDWEGGGSPAGGIPVFGTGSFEFDVMAADASSLTAIDFISGPAKFNFVVRFRGFEDGGSDKVPGQVVPAPAVLSLLAGFGLFGATRKRNRR